MVAVAKTWLKNFSVTSCPIFTWGASKYCPSLHSRRCSLHVVSVLVLGGKDFDDDGSHESCLHRMLLKSTWMIKGKRSWYSGFVNLTLSPPFVLSASRSLILCTSCNLHFPKCFLDTSSLVQPCKQYWQKYLLLLSLLFCLNTSLLKSFTNTYCDVLPAVIYNKFTWC